jgi:nucleotide-binding universal stress UspA family protein
MTTVVVSVDGSAPSHAAVEWTARHVDRDTHVIGVCGLSGLGEFALALPPYELDPPEIASVLEDRWCEPLRNAGIDFEPRLLHVRQLTAIEQTVDAEDPDMLVIGRQHHHGLVDTIVGKGFDHFLHHPPCPVVVVPEHDASGPVERITVDLLTPDGGSAALDWSVRHLPADGTLFAVGNVDDTPDSVHVERHPTDDHRPTTLADLAAQDHADLLVVEEHPELLRRGWVGRLSDAAPCPVVVVPTIATSPFWAEVRHLAEMNPVLAGDPGVVPPSHPAVGASEPPRLP